MIGSWFTCRMKSLEDLKKVLRQAVKRGIIDNFVSNMIEQVIKASTKEVGEIIVPRVDMVAVQENQSIRDVIQIYKQYGYSKMPVISDRNDRVVGILYIKKLLKNLDKLEKEMEKHTVREFMDRANFIPESKKVLDTLNFFQKKHLSIAMVVDEFGSVIGLVTLEDILEEIVGEIWEEFDKEELLYRIIKKGVEYEFNARIELDEVEKILGIKFDTEDVHTLGGFVMSKLEKFPSVRDKIIYAGFEFEVVEATPQRVKKIKVRKLNPGDDAMPLK